MKGAIISVVAQGCGSTTVSDEFGGYRLSLVPGKYLLGLYYGRERDLRKINAPAGKTIMKPATFSGVGEEPLLVPVPSHKIVYPKPPWDLPNPPPTPPDQKPAEAL